MCNDAFLFRTDGRVVECSTQGELSQALGVHLLPLRHGLQASYVRRPGMCLCPIDMERLAADLGWGWDPPDYWRGSDHFDADALRERIPLPPAASGEAILTR